MEADDRSADSRIDHHLRVLGHGHGAFKNLGDKLLHQILATLPRANFCPNRPCSTIWSKKPRLLHNSCRAGLFNLCWISI